MSARGSLLSPDWYRLAPMRPRLRPGVTVSRQRVRGETWYVFSDPVTGRHHRVNDIAYGLIACCDGQRTLDDVWSTRVEVEGDEAASQGEAIQVFVEAFRANLFVGNVIPDADALLRAHRRERRRRRGVNPFAFPVPLWDPDRWLARHVHWFAPLFSRRAQLAAWALIAIGALVFAVNAGDIAADSRQALGSGRMLLIAWLLYPLIKAAHELAHAYAVKAFGGEVHEVGISLLLLTPVPYVDASASVAFPARGERIIVAAAGMMVEALCASAALVAWLLLEPGLAREIALAVVLIGGVSTVLVNGNPLLRFDGYYVLCDALGLPNLAARSQRYWHERLERLLRLRRTPGRWRARGEAAWLLAYAPLSWLCRVGLMLGLALMIAAGSALLGLLVLLAGIWIAVGRPALGLLRWIADAGELGGQRARAAALAALGLAVIASFLLLVPVPDRSHAPAVVWLPDDALVRAGSDGFLDALLVRDGATVAAGAPIARLRNEVLHAELARLDAEITQRRVERDSTFATSARESQIAADELERLEGERERQRQRVAGLTVLAGSAGRVVIDARALRLGQFVRQGELVARVLPETVSLVRALVRNEDIAAVREGLAGDGSVSVRLASGTASVEASVERAIPKATTSLPTRALGDAAGGSIELLADDASGLTAREPRFAFDLRLHGASGARVGTRALATFDHGRATLAELAARLARRSFLKHFAT